MANPYILISLSLVMCCFCHAQAMRTVQHAINDVRQLSLAHSERQHESEYSWLHTFTEDGKDIWDTIASHKSLVNISEGCQNHTVIFLRELVRRKPWTQQVVDATGKLESGVLEGNFNWWGSFSECLNVVIPGNENDTEYQNKEKIDVHMCTVTVSNASIPVPQVKLTLGLCVLSSCSREDVRSLANLALIFFPEEIQATDVVCHSREALPLDAPAIAMICVLSVIGFLILVATLYDLLIVQSGWQQILPKKSPELLVNSDMADDEPVLNFGAYTSLSDIQNGASPEVPQGRCAKLLLSFSICKNGAKILSTERSDTSLDAVHGIRFISLSWVILGHTYVFDYSIISNPIALLDLVKTWHFQAVGNALVSVDSFFLLSGLLVSYLTLKQLEQCEGPWKLNWVKFYFHRFWRLTPPYMLVMGTYIALFKYWGSGPMWPEQKNIDPTCASDWWINMLYLNNLVPGHTQCMAWAWYLANDMQFFIISPIFIVTLYWNWIVGLVITLATILASTIATALINIHHGYGAGLVDSFTNPNMATWFNDLYIKPWCRIGPYLVGILYGYVIFKTRRQVHMYKGFVILCWLANAAMALAVLYGLYEDANGHTLSQPMAALYASTNHTVWGVAVGWVVFACVTGHGGWVNDFLSWPAMIPLSRLSYMAYLIHPVVMYVLVASMKRTIYLETMIMIYLFLGNIVLSYGAAFVVSLSVEAPMLGLEKAIFKRA